MDDKFPSESIYIFLILLHVDWNGPCRDLNPSFVCRVLHQKRLRRHRQDSIQPLGIQMSPPARQDHLNLGMQMISVSPGHLISILEIHFIHMRRRARRGHPLLETQMSPAARQEHMNQVTPTRAVHTKTLLRIIVGIRSKIWRMAWLPHSWEKVVLVLCIWASYQMGKRWL